jgi:two-component system cell cycle response regulator DivK
MVYMNNRTILLVDDNWANLKLIRFLLIQEGFAVLTAATAEEALTALSTTTPDAVLTDIQLPGITGLELTRLIRSDPKTTDIVIVGVSANAMRENVEEAYAAGCDGYITKPVDTRTFAASVREYLDGERAPRRTQMQELSTP